VIIVKTGVRTKRKTLGRRSSQRRRYRNRIRPAVVKQFRGSETICDSLKAMSPPLLRHRAPVSTRALRLKRRCSAWCNSSRRSPNGGKHDDRKQSTKESVAILMSCASKCISFPSRVVCSEGKMLYRASCRYDAAVLPLMVKIGMNVTVVFVYSVFASSTSVLCGGVGRCLKQWSLLVRGLAILRAFRCVK